MQREYSYELHHVLEKAHVSEKVLPPVVGYPGAREGVMVGRDCAPEHKAGHATLENRHSEAERRHQRAVVHVSDSFFFRCPFRDGLERPEASANRLEDTRRLLHVVYDAGETARYQCQLNDVIVGRALTNPAVTSTSVRHKLRMPNAPRRVVQSHLICDSSSLTPSPASAPPASCSSSGSLCTTALSHASSSRGSESSLPDAELADLSSQLKFRDSGFGVWSLGLGVKWSGCGV